jgi:trans-aconitate methyltransferase
VDFGCGVGRLTVPLAQRFERVIGVDISPAMIAESRRNCSLRGVTNAEFVGTDDLVPSGVQLVHSYLVLQHIPVKRGLVVVKRLIDRLAPGGVCALHVPMQREKRRIAYLIKHYVPISRYALNVLQGKDIREPLMQMNSYPARRMFDSLNDAGVRDIWVIPLIPFPGLNGLSVIWLGRKGG